MILGLVYEFLLYICLTEFKRLKILLHRVQLRVIMDIKETDKELEFLLKESLELKKILGSISSKSVKRNSK